MTEPCDTNGPILFCMMTTTTKLMVIRLDSKPLSLFLSLSLSLSLSLYRSPPFFFLLLSSFWGQTNIPKWTLGSCQRQFCNQGQWRKDTERNHPALQPTTMIPHSPPLFEKRAACTKQASRQCMQVTGSSPRPVNILVSPS